MAIMSEPTAWTIRRRAARYEIVLYLVVAYALSWSIWPLVLANPESSPMIPFGPALAAVLVAGLIGGRRQVSALLRGLVRYRTRPRWYAVALVGPVLVTGGAFAAGLVRGASLPGWEASDLAQVGTTVATTFVIVGLFEELGWRGFLLPRLQQGRRALDAALLVGLAWLPWHLPELVSDPSQRPLLPCCVIIMAESVILAWLYNGTAGSLPVVMLCHAALNGFAKFFFADLQGDAYQAAWWALSLLTAAFATALVWYAGPAASRPRR
jgi:membrane protease YdiL (CAAX protease family)